MKQIVIILFISILWTSYFVQNIYAVEKEAAGTAVLQIHAPVTDERVEILENFLTYYNPDLVGSASQFVAEADRLNLDWKFIVSIAGVESTFCRHIPSSSYNCWGWGIPTGASDGIRFTSYNDGITKVSEGLRNNYISKGLITIDQIGRVYAASPMWSYKVRYFMEKIEHWKPKPLAYYNLVNL